MKTSSTEFYIRRDYGFYDSGILGCLSPILFNVYEVIRRFVWRSADSGDPKWRDLFKNNKLASTVSQTEIGEAVGRDRNTANEYIRALKKLGWLKVIPGPDKQTPATYVLGERVKDSQGRYHEVFFADAWMADLWAKLVETAEEQGDIGERPTKLPWDVRRGICNEWIEKTSFKPKKKAPKTEGPSEDSEDFVEAGLETSDEFEEVAAVPDNSGKGEESDSESSSESNEEEPLRCTENRAGVAPKTVHGLHRNRSNVGGDVAPKTAHISIEGTSSHRSTELGTRYREPPQPEFSRVRSPESASALSDSLPHVSEKDEFTSSASTREKTRVRAYDSDASATDRLAHAAEVAAGRAVPALESTNLTFKQKAEAARSAQAKALLAKESKLRNFDSTKPYEVRRVMSHLEKIWGSESRSKFGPVAGAWQVQDRKMVEGLMKAYTVDLIEKGMRYLIGNWDGLAKRLFKGNGGTLPTVAVLSRCHATIFPEASDYAELSVLLSEWKTWFAANPDDDPPGDLEQRFDIARPKLKAMGLI